MFLSTKRLTKEMKIIKTNDLKDSTALTWPSLVAAAVLSDENL